VKCWNTSRPYAGDASSHTADYCAKTILPVSREFYKGKNRCVRSFSGVGKYPAPLLLSRSRSLSEYHISQVWYSQGGHWRDFNEQRRNEMRTKRRLLSILLALVMCLGLAVPAFAGSSGDLSENYEVFEEEDQVDCGNYFDFIDRYGLKDKSGNVVIPATYAGMALYKGMIIAAGEGIAHRNFVDKDIPQYGVIDLNQNVIIPYQYELIEPVSSDSFRTKAENHVYPADQSKGYLRIVKNGLSGVMTDDLQIIIPSSYCELQYTEPGYFKVSDTYNARAKASDIAIGIVHGPKGRKWGLCDKNGKLVVPVKYDEITYLGGDYFAVQDGMYAGVLNGRNETVIPMEYGRVKAMYEDCFIVTKYLTKDPEELETADLFLDGLITYWGEQIVADGVVDLNNRPLIDFSKYEKITVSENGVFTCGWWNGEIKPADYYFHGSERGYQHAYEYDYINYSQLSVTANPTSPVPSNPQTVPSEQSYHIPDSEGLAELSAPPIRTYADTITDFDANWDTFDRDITVYEVADGTKLILTDTAKQKGYTVSRLGGGVEEISENELVLYPTGPRYQWYSLLADGETYEEVDANTVDVFIRTVNQKSGTFSDVKASDYYRDAIQWAVKYGVTSGTSATTFSPNDTCTVGQILTFLWRADGGDKAWEYGDKKFGNIARNDYYYYAALWALNEYEMVSGANFAADTPCTRSMVATYLWKMAYCPEQTSTGHFTDVPASAEYAQAVNWMVEQGITSGTTATTFSPNETCTRGQIATFIYRYFTNLNLA